MNFDSKEKMKTKLHNYLQALAQRIQAARARHCWGKKEYTLNYILFLFTIVCAGAPKISYAEEIFVLSSVGQLVRFETTNLGAPISTVTLTGLETGDSIADIDFRPVNGSLVGVGSLGNVYNIDAVSGVAVKINSAPLFPAPTGSIFSIDFNPSVDRIRFVSNSGQNFRIDPETGAVAGTDTSLSFAPGDSSSSLTPIVSGNAYADNFSGTTATTLYAIDPVNNLLLRQGSFDASPVSPNTGQLFTVGSLGETVTGSASFDISAETGLAYTAFVRSGRTSPELFTVSLGTGRLTSLGEFPILGSVKAIAIPTLPARFISLATSTGGISVINVDSPSLQFKSKTVTGLQPSETILAIDYRPATNELYALGSLSRIYKLNIDTGAATLVGSGFTPVLAGTEFGMDFNPSVDRLRVVSDSGSNFRIDPNTGAVAGTDIGLVYAPGDINAGISGKGVGLAYTDSALGAATTAYLIDSAVGNLTTLGSVGGSTSPNTGLLFTVGILPAAITTNTGFDIAPGDNTGYVNFGNSLYEIDQVTGKGFLRGTTTNTLDIAALPSSTFSVTTSTATGQEALATASVTVIRTRNLIGTAFVPYRTVNGTASAGTDFTEAVGVLTFVDGESSKVIPLTIANDSSAESIENFTVQLLPPFGGVLGSQTTSNISIIDSIDSDSDGFSNQVEAAAGTNPNNAASNPVGASGPVSPRSISTARLSLTFDLTRTRRDSILFTGRVSTSSSFNPNGKFMFVEVGGLATRFKINSRGVGTRGSMSVRLNKIRGGYGYSLSVPRTDLSAVLEDQGITRDTPNKTKFAVPTSVVLDQRLSTKLITLTYSVARATRAIARN